MHLHEREAFGKCAQPGRACGRASGGTAGTGQSMGLSGMWNVNRVCYQQQPRFGLQPKPTALSLGSSKAHAPARSNCSPGATCHFSVCSREAALAGQLSNMVRPGLSRQDC